MLFRVLLQTLPKCLNLPKSSFYIFVSFQVIYVLKTAMTSFMIRNTTPLELSSQIKKQSLQKIFWHISVCVEWRAWLCGSFSTVYSLQRECESRPGQENSSTPDFLCKLSQTVQCNSKHSRNCPYVRSINLWKISVAVYLSFCVKVFL